MYVRFKSLRLPLNAKHSVGINLIANIPKHAANGSSDRQQIPRMEMAWIKNRLPEPTIPFDVPGSNPIRRKESLNEIPGVYPVTRVQDNCRRDLTRLIRSSANLQRKSFVSLTTAAQNFGKHDGARDRQQHVKRNMKNATNQCNRPP